MADCYTIKIHYRAKLGSDREKWVLECAKEYGCEPDTHLIDRLLADRFKLLEYRAKERLRLDAIKAQLAEDERVYNGG